MANYVNTQKDKRAKIIIVVFTLLFTAIFMMLAFVLEPSEGNRGYKVSGTLTTGSNSISVKGSEYTYYKFVPNSSETYEFYSTNGSSSMDPSAVLYDEDWYQLTSNDNDTSSNSSNKNFKISRSLYSGTTYYLGVRVSSNSSSSSSNNTVTVYVGLSSKDGSSNNGSGNNGGNTVSGTLSTGNNSITVNGSNTTYYRFTPSSSGTYVFTSTNGSSSLDPKATLYNSSWTELTSDDDGNTNTSSGRDFRISRQLTSGTTYYLGVSVLSNSSSKTVTVNVTRS